MRITISLYEENQEVLAEVQEVEEGLCNTLKISFPELDHPDISLKIVDSVMLLEGSSINRLPFSIPVLELKPS